MRPRAVFFGRELEKYFTSLAAVSGQRAHVAPKQARVTVHRSRKGLQLPLAGEPVQEIERARPVRRVAVLASDFVGLRPAMRVAVGDDVSRGQVLFEDKQTPGVRHTAPAAGTVRAIYRGERRALQSVVLDVSRAEHEGRAAAEASFSAFSGRHPSGMAADSVVALLVEAGLWTSLRARPFGRVADPTARPAAILVTAVDSNPHAPVLDLVLRGVEPVFERGLAALARLTDGPVFVCTAAGSDITVPTIENVRREEFHGPHPSGTAGFHMHTLAPVDRATTAWHVGAQDVVAIGRLFETGQLDPTRVVSLAGPAVRRPRLIRTRMGASVDELLTDETGNTQDAEDIRAVSGSVLSGRAAAGEVHGFLGRYDQQISVLGEGRRREFFGWLAPGLGKFSVTPTFVSRLTPGRRFRFTTTTNGSRRAIVPIGVFERVMPFDILPTPLLRALLMTDIERAEELGCLELAEEDLALCTFVCPGKNDYGPLLRQVLNEIEKEG